MANRWLITCGLALTLIHGAAFAGTAQKQTLKTATNVLQEYLTLPEGGIPPSILDEVYGIAVIPGLIRAGLVIGARHGNGVMAVRTEDGKWSNPVFISVSGGSFGLQLGVSSSDVILVFRSNRSIQAIANGTFTMGGNLTAAAGPVGRSLTAATNLSLDAEIFSYSRSRGLFAGAALRGAVLSMNHAANATFYNNPDITAKAILHSTNRAVLPPAGNRFITFLQRYIPLPGVK